MKPDHPTSVYRMRRILDLLLDDDLDQKQLADRLHLTRPASIKKYLTHLKAKQQRKIHIVRWRPRGPNGHSWAVYRFGRGPNAKPPPVKPMSQVHREWRERKGIQPRRDPAPPAVVGDPFDHLFKR